MIEGTVSLPSSQKWTLHFYARTDGDVNLPSEYINLYINGALIDKVFNTPPNKFTPYSVEFTGDELTYRFEFSSPSTTFTDHMLVLDGIVSPEKNDGLVAYYPFNGNADDLSGNGNNGIVHGAALTEDRFGNANSAYHFDGIDDYIMIPHSEDFKFGVYDFTISLWLQYPSQTGGTHDYSAVFMKVENSSFPWDGITFFVDYPNQGNTCFRTDARYYLLSNTDALNDNTWRHYVLVRKGDSLKLYINAKLDNSDSFPLTYVSNNANILIGCNHIDTKAQNYLGKMDDIRIYNRALSADEIWTLYNQPVADAGPDQIVCNAICSGVVLDGRKSYDPNGHIVSYVWELKHRENSSYNLIVNGKTPAILDLEPGIYDTTLTITDDDNLTDTDAIILEVLDTCNPCTIMKGDLDGDGDIDGDDLSMFSKHYGTVPLTP